jgi:hypothetical protein
LKLNIEKVNSENPCALLKELYEKAILGEGDSSVSFD